VSEVSFHLAVVKDGIGPTVLASAHTSGRCAGGAQTVSLDTEAAEGRYTLCCGRNGLRISSISLDLTCARPDYVNETLSPRVLRVGVRIN